MNKLRGTVVVIMRFEIPVNEEMYPLVAREGEVTPEDIVAAEEQNHLADPDSYLDAIGQFIKEVDISFQRKE
jgi:hypothetical protein